VRLLGIYDRSDPYTPADYSAHPHTDSNSAGRKIRHDGIGANKHPGSWIVQPGVVVGKGRTRGLFLAGVAVIVVRGVGLLFPGAVEAEGLVSAFLGPVVAVIVGVMREVLPRWSL